METSALKRWLMRWWLLWLPPVLILLSVLFYPQLLVVERFVADYILSCPVYDLTGLYCPGCGGTRSLTALLHGKILLAFHENPITPLLLLFLLAVYAEQAAKLFGKRIRLYPRSHVFWYTLLGMQLTWAVLRNFIPVLMPFTPIN